MSREQKRFYDELQNIFVGAKVEGQGGFINLMKIKSSYYSVIKNRLQQDIEDALEAHPSFRDELFDKLWSFFSRYFTQNGSIYFNETTFHNNVYEKVYTSEKDVVLFWKTHMLYYVKTDSLYQSMPIEFDELKFYFDASNLKNKKANEKKSLVFKLKENETNGIIHFEVTRSENGSKTKIDEIEKTIQKRDVSIDSDDLKKAFNLFERQSEVDYFINKNAESFLKEQFKLWSYQYFWEGAPDWDAERVNQLQILKDIAFKIIDFIAQFEDELVKIWNKPKFVKNAHYVITIDRLNGVLQQKIRKAEGYREQVDEWKAMGIETDNPKAPIDTKHFKELELEILSQFDNLDEALDGWLIKSENYQALNTILPKFRGKVQCVYIDPPFNLDKNADYEYAVNYKNSSWATILENRINCSKNILSAQKSCFFTRCDYHGNWIVRLVMDEVFGAAKFRNEIDIKRNQSLPKTGDVNLVEETENLLIYAPGEGFVFLNQLVDRDDIYWGDLGTRPADKKDNPSRLVGGIEFRPPDFRRWSYSQDNLDEMYENGRLKIENGKLKILIDKKRVGTNWTDIIGYSSSPAWGFKTENSEKLLHRVFNMSSNEKDLVLDFFLGSGTSIAVAHKLNRRWIGIELGEHFYSVILPRMKKVLAYDRTGISREIKKYQGGGFFKYYEMEQYEETLDRCKYENGDIINHTEKSTYEQYVFLPDGKMLAAIESDYANDKFRVDLSKLYDNIDIPETLSNLKGKWIKAIKKDKIIFDDNTEINSTDIDYQTIMPLIWWE